MTIRRRLLGVSLAALLILAAVSAARTRATESDPPDARDPVFGARQSSPTAVPLQFPTPTATAGPPTETPTRTATAQGNAVVEAISADTNVRAGPDINENRIGQIQPGEQYPVLGRRFEWYQIEFISSPTGTGWVYSQVVTLTGDPALIPEIGLDDIPTVDPAFLSNQQTVDAVANTPGAYATLTAAAALTPQGVFTADPSAEATLDPNATFDPNVPLPTFTYPPYTPTPVAFPRTNAPTEQASGMPPLLPILALGGLGLLGLLVSILRRL